MRAASVAIAAVQSVGPRDGVEAMLAVQMTASTHAAAMRMLHRAALDQPSFEIYDSLVNRATKLLRTYTMQLEALKRYRSAGEQRASWFSTSTSPSPPIRRPCRSMAWPLTLGGGGQHRNRRIKPMHPVKPDPLRLN